MKNAALSLAIILAIISLLSGGAWANPYKDKLDKIQPYHSIKSDNYGNHLAQLKDNNVLFQIKKKGVETENPVDDFLSFAEYLNLYESDNTRTYTTAYDSLFFLVILKEGRSLMGYSNDAIGFKSDKFDDLKKIVEGDDRNGDVLPVYFDIKDKDGKLFKYYLVQTRDFDYFLDAIFNFESWADVPYPKAYYTLKHDKGEKVLFIPKETFPKVRFDFKSADDKIEQVTLENVELYQFRSDENFDILVSQIRSSHQGLGNFESVNVKLWSDPDLGLGENAWYQLKFRE